MFIFRKILLFANPILFIAGLEFIRHKQLLWWLVLAISVVLLFLTVFEYSKRKFKIEFFNFLISPLALVLSSFAFLLYIENAIIYRVTAIVTGFLLYLFLDQILNYFYFSLKYQPYTLESFSFYTNILSVFFISSALFSTLIFLHLNRLLIAGIGFVFLYFVVYELFWVNKIEWSKSKVFVFIIPLCLSQLFIAISYLPTSYFVNAALLSLTFYVLVGLARLFLLENLARKNVINYLVIAVASIVLVLVTAQWI